MVTRGIAALRPETVSEIAAAVASFDDFSADNDPHGEHDFGALSVSDHRVFFKIDCYGIDMASASPDPADEAVTRRVMTIMLAEEY